jgi:hypothetical protein
MWPTVLVDELIGYAKTNLRIDTNRIYLTGLSMGGGGTYKYISNRFAFASKPAAAATICSPCTFTNGDPVAKANLPVWSFHAANDSITSSTCTDTAVARINAANPGVLAQKTIWPTGGHGVWDRVYADTNYYYNSVINIYEWFLAQNKSLPVNKLPVADVGPDLVVNSSSGIAAVTGAASTDEDGKIVRYVWRRLTGPTGSVITTSFGSDAVTSISGLKTSGTYRYELSVVDDRAGISRDTLTIRVPASSLPLPGAVDSTVKPNLPPNALTVPDKTVMLTYSDRAMISGTPSTDADGWIKSFKWIRLSGPTGAGMIENASMGRTWALNLKHGTYRYRVIVSDNKGALSYDDITVFADSTGLAAKLAKTAVTASSIKIEEDIKPVMAETLKVYPNPTSGSVRIQYASPEAGRSAVTVFDMNGRRIRNFTFAKAEGVYHGNLDLGGLISGLYYIEVSTNNKRLRSAIIKN